MNRALALVTAVAVTGLALLPPTAGASTAPEAKAPTATLNALPPTAEVGKKVKLKGRLGDSKATVRIQRQYPGGKWATVEKISTDAQGRFKQKVALTQPGKTSFRVKGSGKAKTPARTLDVFGWLDLTKQPYVVEGGSGYVNGPVTIGGRVFPTAFVTFDDSTFRSFDISGCTKVEGWTGFADGSGAGPADRQGLQWNSGTYTETIPEPPLVATPPGPAVRRTISVAGDNVMYLALRVEQASGTKIAVMGSPRAYCDVAQLKVPPVPAPVSRPAARWSVG